MTEVVQSSHASSEVRVVKHECVRHVDLTVALLRHRLQADFKRNVVEVLSAAFQLSTDVLLVATAASEVVQLAACRGFVCDVEGRTDHLGEAEAHRFVQVVNSMKKIAEIPSADRDDSVVAVVREVLDETRSEETHEFIVSSILQHVLT